MVVYEPLKMKKVQKVRKKNTMTWQEWRLDIVINSLIDSTPSFFVLIRSFFRNVAL